MLDLARTDAEAADLLTSDYDENDKPFLTGERTIEGFYNGASIGSRTHDHAGGTLAGGTPGFEAYNSGASLGKVGAWEGGDYPAGGGGAAVPPPPRAFPAPILNF